MTVVSVGCPVVNSGPTAMVGSDLIASAWQWPVGVVRNGGAVPRLHDSYFHDAQYLVHHRGMARYTDPQTRVASADEGVGAGDLVRVRRALFMGALDVARADHDPAAEWGALAEVAWREASLAFGFAAREELPRLSDQDDNADGGSGHAG